MKKLIILVGLLFMASCASVDGGAMDYADPHRTNISSYINDSPSNPLGDGLRGFGN